MVAIVTLGLAGCGSGTNAESTALPETDSVDTTVAEVAYLPPNTVEFITAGDPGGGLDLFARQIQIALSEEGLLDTQMDITNLGGGGGNPAMAMGRERAGQDSTLLGNSNRVFLNTLLGTTDLQMGVDFVPIASIISEFVVMAVRADSPYKTGPEVLDALNKDPRSLNLGVGTVPSNDQIHLLQLAEATGTDATALNIVAFSSGGDLMTQLLGGFVDVISTGLSEALPQYLAGEIRILGISAEQRLEGEASEIPTWREQNIDVVVAHWRGIFGPADMPSEAVEYWEETFAKLVETETWAKMLNNNKWSSLFKGSKDFTVQLNKDREIYAALLEKVGLLVK
jgi:putative tricarboxylic transport membrane protein